MNTRPWQENDNFHDDPRWAKMAAGYAVTVDQLQAAYCRLRSVAHRHLSDGWLTEQTTLSLAGPDVIAGLASRPLADRPSILHRRGDHCTCYAEWRQGYDYLMHQGESDEC